MEEIIEELKQKNKQIEENNIKYSIISKELENKSTKIKN